MSSRLRRSTILCALVLVLVVSAGCLGDGGESALPDSETVSESLGSVDAINATVSLEVTTGNETTNLTMDLVRRTSSGEFRATVKQKSPDVRYRMVSNGSTMWVYNHSTNTATRFDIGGIRTRWNSSVESVSGVFDALQQSEDDEPVSISPLPMVPGGSSASGANVGMGSMPAMGNVSLSYEGTESVGGRDAYVVDVQPVSNQSVVTNGTFWFDTERYLPIKSVYEMSIGGQHREVTRTYRNLTYDPSIPEGAFTFEAPPNATVETRSNSISVYQSLSDLEDATELSVPEPDVPDGYAFAQASTAVQGENTTLAIQYSNGDGTVIVAKQRGPAVNLTSDDGERVSIADREGTYRSVQGTSTLSWSCEGTRYVVQGSLSKSELVTIAESMACD